MSPILAQTTDDLLSLSDVDELSESAYLRLLEIEAQQHLSDRHNLILRYDQCLNRREGYRYPTASRRQQSKAYLGDPLHETVRYLFKREVRRQSSWQAGLVLDKDAGERWNYRPPFSDSFSLYAAYECKTGWLRQALVGHYRVKMGSGLLCNQQFSLGKNLSSSAFFTHVKDLSPHSSAGEDNFMQGAAMRFRLGEQWELVPFVSVRSIDGTLKSDTLTSWATDGYHRTQNEKEKRHQAWLLQSGLSAKRMGEWYAVAAHVFYSHFDKPFYRPIRTYNRNQFRGHQLLQGSFSYEARWWNFHGKGETAVDDQGGWATIHALQFSFLDTWSAVAMYRQYSNRYRQLSASSVSESSAMQGERGETISLEGPIARYWQLHLSADFFQFSQAQYGIYQPSEGYELTARINYEKSSQHQQSSQNPFSCSFRYRLKAKYKNNTLTKAPLDLTPYYQHSLYAVLNWNIIPSLSSKTQLHGRIYSAQNTGSTETGWAISEGIGWNRESFPLRLHVQGTYFKTDNYDCRVYLSEKNILYGFGLPMLYGEGIRWSVTLTYQVGKHLHLEAKYARTTYKNVSSIGSGLQQISGNHQDNLWIQLRAKL